MKSIKSYKLSTKIKKLGSSLIVLTASGAAFAGENLGTMASTLTATFSSVGAAITALSYVAGLGFAIAAILQFKQHKENPSQTPIGKPISQILIAAALLFLPSMFTAVGNTIFSQGGTTAGSSGTEITGSSS
ncbi:MAG: type IV secretion protein IcmD [Gammaproteobacteria bacterium]